jgi:hypothetical protein
VYGGNFQLERGMHSVNAFRGGELDTSRPVQQGLHLKAVWRPPQIGLRVTGLIEIGLYGPNAASVLIGPYQPVQLAKDDLEGALRRTRFAQRVKPESGGAETLLLSMDRPLHLSHSGDQTTADFPWLETFVPVPIEAVVDVLAEVQEKLHYR